MINVFVFDIETVPDVAGARKTADYQDLNDDEIYEAFTLKRREKSNTDFWPLYLQKVVAISAVLHVNDTFKVWSLGTQESDEKELIQRFYTGLARYTPTLVSWNGKGFDSPVLHYRALIHGITAERYWESGETDNQFKWNNYLNRYHNRHFDMMDVLASYSPKAYAPLDHIASLLGCPGKMGMSGSKVYEYFKAGKIKQIRDYCETDVLNTYLVYLAFEKMRGTLSDELHQTYHENLKTYLAESNQPHFNEFLESWQQAA